MNELVVTVLVSLGGLAVLVAAVGLVRMPDRYRRKEAKRKAAKPGVIVVPFGTEANCGDIAITVRQEGDRIILSCREADRLYARLVLMESVAQLIQMLEGLRHLENVDTFRDQVMS